MEEQDKVNPEYLKGFNQGYVLSREMPELIRSLQSATGEHQRLQGLKDGAKEFEKERQRSKEQEEIDKYFSDDDILPTTPPKPNKDRDRDIEFPDRE